MNTVVDNKLIDKKKILEDYKTFLRFQTISSDSTKKQAIQDCAQWLASHLKSIGLTRVIVHQTQLHPVVYADYIVNPSFKTILFYGHYDVQPVTPLSAWKSHPFHPTIINDHMYARGASDDKGQMFIHIKAIEHVLKNKISLRVNIKCLFEGEEEIGSPSLPSFMQQNKALMKANVVVVSDTKMLSENQPAITYSLRGSLNAEIKISGRSKDLHSGTFGGMIQNPADVLGNLVTNLQDKNGRIQIPGFYSEIIDEDSKDRNYMRLTGPSDHALQKDAGVQQSWGEPHYTNYERTTIRPSLVVTTLQSGHIGEGCKNVIPAIAVAKINLRLVKGQSPLYIAASFKSFVKQNIPEGFSYTIRFSSPSKSVQLSRNHPYLKAAADAYNAAFGRAPVFIRSGGTIPVVGLFYHQFAIPVVLMGFALASDNMHAPDEKFYLPNLFRGIQTSIRFIQNLSIIKTQQNAGYR